MGPDQVSELLRRVQGTVGDKPITSSALIVELLRATGDSFDDGRALPVAERMNDGRATREAPDHWLTQMASMFHGQPSTGLGTLIAGVGLTDQVRQ